MLYTLLISALFLNVNSDQSYNDCKTYAGYFYRNSDDCYYNPDVEKDMPTLVQQHNYTLETFEVTTKDGYRLTVYRLPQAESVKGVVFLQHSPTASATYYLDKGNNASLAYSLFKAGYEVWLGNFRGNYYSRKHTTLSPKANKFWNFTFHEMGIYDIPAMVELAVKTSNIDKISFIAHSMGGSAAAIYASLLPKHAEKHVNLFVLMAPAVYLANVTSPVKYVAPFAEPFYKIASLFEKLEVLPHSKAGSICYKIPAAVHVCIDLELLIMGTGEGPTEQTTPELAPLLFSQNPAGTSLKVLVHMAQSIETGGHFRYYDYGSSQNQKYYNSDTPPDYPIENITVPVYLLSGAYDSIVTKEGIKILIKKLGTNVNAFEPEVEDSFNHLNFVYAKDLDTKINQRIKKVLEQIN